MPPVVAICRVLVVMNIEVSETLNVFRESFLLTHAYLLVTQWVGCSQILVHLATAISYLIRGSRMFRSEVEHDMAYP